jgi:glycerol-3-phosphate acyltransferase PlsY
MAIWFGLILGAYLLGSVPVSYLAAKRFSGIDLRQYGTGQVGGGNLWRMTSWRLGLPVGAFDFGKGLLMVWVAQLLGLNVAQQVIVGLGAAAGHNWSVFLRFDGGRGFATVAGVILILPVINALTPWPTVVFLTILLTGVVIMRSSPVAALLAAAALPMASWWSGEPTTVTLSFLAVFLVIVIRRLTAPKPVATVSRKRLFLRKAWMYRKPNTNRATERSEPEES